MSLLTSKEKSTLRSEAQKLKPSIFVGKQGLQEGVVKELKQAFSKHELIKVAFKAERSELAELVTRVEAETGSECVGGVGKRRSFYRAVPNVEAEEG